VIADGTARARDRAGCSGSVARLGRKPARRSLGCAKPVAGEPGLCGRGGLTGGPMAMRT